MRIALGGDHAGLAMKEWVQSYVGEKGHTVLDVGAYSYDPDDDYPDFAAAVGYAVAGGDADRGILVCGSGVGAAIAANKIDGVRACLCHDIYSATQGVEHDDMNVLCLGGLIIGKALAARLIDGFLAAQFQPKERYQRRLNKVLALERDD